jgi:hypothetical protein
MTATPTLPTPFQTGRLPHDPAWLAGLPKLEALTDLTTLPKCPPSWHDRPVIDGIGLYPLDGNDAWGDCVPASMAHLRTSFQRRLGRNMVDGAASVIHWYIQQTNDPTPPGPGMSAAAAFANWYAGNFPTPGNRTERAAALATVSPSTPPATLKQLCWLFRGLWLSWDLPASCFSMFAQGNWVVDGPPAGLLHMTATVGYDETGWDTATWGGIIGTSEPFVPAYSDMVGVVLGSDWKSEPNLEPERYAALLAIETALGAAP